MDKSQQQTLLCYINEQAKVSDQNSKEWKAAGDEVNSAYRAGMWYAYNDIRNRISYEQQTDPATATSFQSGWRRGMMDALDMIQKGVSLEMAVGAFKPENDPATAISRLYPSSARPVNPQSK